jgi:hypothetical protein
MVDLETGELPPHSQEGVPSVEDDDDSEYADTSAEEGPELLTA